MAERSKAAVLKTVDVKASWGSNPYLPATFYHLKLSNIFRLFLFDFNRNSRILNEFKLRNSRIPKCLYISAYIFSSLIASLSMMPIPRFSVFFAISCASYKECIL